MKTSGIKVPERGPDEGPATEDQIQYILRLADPADEQEVRHLGKSQASSMIDQLRDLDWTAPPKAKRGLGWLGWLVALGAAAGVGWVIVDRHRPDDPGDEVELPTPEEWRQAKPPTPSVPEETEEASSPTSAEIGIKPEPGPNSPSPSEPLTKQRTWTARDGRTLEATLLRLSLVEGKYVGLFEKPGGETFEYKIANLSPADIALVKGLVAEK